MQKVLYCFTLNTAITPALLHRLAYRNEAYAVFMCDKTMFYNRGVADSVKKLKEKGIIDDLILENLLIDYTLKIGIDEYSRYVEKVYDEIFSRSGYTINDFDEIYCINDIWGAYPNLYFNIKKKLYYWLNDACNSIGFERLSQVISILNLDRLESEEFVALIDKYHVLGAFAPFAIPVLQSNSSNETLDKLCGKRYITWNKEYAIQSLNSEVVDRIVSCFDVDNIIIDNTCDFDYIIVNSWGAASHGGYRLYGDEIRRYIGEKFLNHYELIAEFIKILTDYYASSEKRIVIKSHPAEYLNQSIIKSLLGDEYISAGNINFEFLQMYYRNHKIKFNSIIGMDSTSFECITGDVFKNKIRLGASFFDVWYYYNALYVVLKCLFQNNMQVRTTEYIANQSNLLIKYCNLLGECDTINIYDIDDINYNDVIMLNALHLERDHINISDIIRHVGQSANIVFFNINYTKLFFEKDIQNRLLYIDIQKEFHNDGHQGFAKPEMVWFYCGTFDFYKKMLKFSLSQDMPRQNFLLNANMKVPDKIVLNSMFNIPAQFAKNNHEYKDMQEWLVNEKDIHKYINRVKLLTKGALLIIAINEGIPKNFDKKILDALRQMGFNNIPSVPGYSYIGIMCDGKINYNKKGSVVGQPVVCNGNVDNLKMEVISSAGKTNNKAVIKINDYDYAINDKGINLFILDLNDRKILESVAISVEADEIRFNRKQKINEGVK